jgi:VanZ family protein
MRLLKNHRRLIIAILWTLVIFVFSLQNGEDSLSLSLVLFNALASVFTQLSDPSIQAFAVTAIRKVAHFTEYFILGALYAKADPDTPLDLLEIGLFIPFMDEGLQGFVDGRGSSLIDVMIDLAGYCLGLWIFGGFKQRRLQRYFKKNETTE